MSRKKANDTPTDEKIMSYVNVPVEIAAKYIGWSSCNVRYALQQERAPYGHAVQTGEKPDGTPTYSYHISPGLLIGYQRGTIQAWKLSKLARFIEDLVQRLIEIRIRACGVPTSEVA